MSREQLFQDFLVFCDAQLKSMDVDPLYPVLQAIEQGMSLEQSLWHTLLYVGYYNIASATLAMSEVPEPAPLPSTLAKLSTGIERRGFRNGSIVQHIESLLSIKRRFGGFAPFLTQGFGNNYRENWHILQETLQIPWGNGRWAAYKTGEILQKVHSFPVEPTDMGHAFSSGPRQGLALFYGDVPGNTPEVVHRLDQQGEKLLMLLRKAGSTMGIEQLETMLCDFHALVHGRYYVGHDIDLLQRQILTSRLSKHVQEPLWEARLTTLPHAYLGEIGGWQGVEKQRKQIYQKTGRVVVRD